MQGIYKITNKRTGECYIGKSVDVTRRWEQHTNELEKGKHANKRLQNMFNKKGHGLMLDLSFETLEVFKNATEKKLLEREAYWINKFKTKKLMNTQIPAYKKVGFNFAQSFITILIILTIFVAWAK